MDIFTEMKLKQNGKIYDIYASIQQEDFFISTEFLHKNLIPHIGDEIITRDKKYYKITFIIENSINTPDVGCYIGKVLEIND